MHFWTRLRRWAVSVSRGLGLGGPTDECASTQTIGSARKNRFCKCWAVRLQVDVQEQVSMVVTMHGAKWSGSVAVPWYTFVRTTRTIWTPFRA